MAFPSSAPSRARRGLLPRYAPDPTIDDVLREMRAAVTVLRRVTNALDALAEPTHEPRVSL